MNHKMGYRKLGRDSAHRKAMLQNLSKSLLKAEKIETTLTRAKELRRIVERIITLGKKGELHHKRRAFAYLRDDELLNKLFNDISLRYKERNGGYTRILRTPSRRGDAAKMAIIELVK